MIIDSEFRGLIAPLSNDEQKQLECNLIADGCRDALVVWNGILLDGHHRYEICTTHHLPYQTVEQPCADRDAAKLWILQHQLGRRNLNDYQRAELAILLEPLLAAEAQSRMLNTLKPFAHLQLAPIGASKGKTSSKLAAIAGISEQGMERALCVSKRGSPELKNQVRTGKVALSAAAARVRAGEAIVPSRRRPQSHPTHRKEDRTLAGQIAVLLSELRRQRKENHDELRARRWIPGNIVTRLQTEQLNWIETELEHLVVQLRAPAIDVPTPRAKTARPVASTGDNGHG